MCGYGMKKAGRKARFDQFGCKSLNRRVCCRLF